MLHFRFVTRFPIGLESIFILYNPAVSAINRSISPCKKKKKKKKKNIFLFHKNEIGKGVPVEHFNAPRKNN